MCSLLDSPLSSDCQAFIGLFVVILQVIISEFSSLEITSRQHQNESTILIAQQEFIV